MVEDSWQLFLFAGCEVAEDEGVEGDFGFEFVGAGFDAEADAAEFFGFEVLED